MARTPSVEIEFGFQVPAGKKLLDCTDKQTRTLTFDYNARAELQDIVGAYESNMATMKAVRAGVYVCLLAETLDKWGRKTPRTLSIIDVGNIYDQMAEDDQVELVKALQTAMGLSEAPLDDRPPGPAPE